MNGYIKVNNQRRRGNRHDGNRDTSEDHVVIGLQNRILDQRTDTRVTEDDFCHDGTAEDAAKAHGQSRNLGQDGVTENVGLHPIFASEMPR